MNTIPIEHSEPTEDLLMTIVNMAGQQQRLEDDITILEDQLKRKEKELDDVSVNILPELMNKARLKTFQNEEGLIINIDPGFHCKVPKNKNNEAMQWLEDNGFGRIISRNIIINFAKEDEAACKELLKEFKDRKDALNFKEEQSVHHATLKAQVKKICEDGKLIIPKDVFGIFDRPQAVITYTKK